MRRSVNPASHPRRRERQAEATRRDIVEAARRLFAERGFAGTTVDAIAEEAGVAVQTIYNSLGSKGGVLARLLDVTIAGDHEDASIVDRVRPGLIGVEDPRELVADLARTAARIHERTADVFELLAAAGPSDPQIAALDRNNRDQRLAAYTFAAGELQARGGLRAGLGRDDAAARIWAIANPATYRFLVVERGWTVERYRRWLEGTLGAALLP